MTSKGDKRSCCPFAQMPNALRAEALFRTCPAARQCQAGLAETSGTPTAQMIPGGVCAACRRPSPCFGCDYLPGGGLCRGCAGGHTEQVVMPIPVQAAPSPSPPCYKVITPAARKRQELLLANERASEDLRRVVRLSVDARQLSCIVDNTIRSAPVACPHSLGGLHFAGTRKSCGRETSRPTSV
jgi:hypothetical protein